MPCLGEYNDDAFATIDFAIAYAGTLGIRLILPLTDEWEYYHGGHRDFTTPLGLQSADFYTDPCRHRRLPGLCRPRSSAARTR